MKREKQRTEYPRTVNNYKRYNIQILGIFKEENRQQETEEMIEGILTENFLKLMTDPNPQIQEAGITPSSLSTKKIYTKVDHIQSGKKKKKAKIKSQR